MYTLYRCTCIYMNPGIHVLYSAVQTFWLLKWMTVVVHCKLGNSQLAAYISWKCLPPNVDNNTNNVVGHVQCTSVITKQRAMYLKHARKVAAKPGTQGRGSWK